MADTNPSINDIPIKPIVAHILRTLIFLLVLSLIISVVRAGVVLHELQQAAANEAYNARFMAKWIPPYPTLYNAFLRLQLDQKIHVPRQPALERMLLKIPNQLVNFTLKYTQPLWLPANTPETISAQAGRPPPNDAPTRVTVPRQRRASAPTSPATKPAPLEQEPIRPPTDENIPSDPNAMWAAVTTPAAPIYNTNGQLQENIPPGSVVEILDERSTSNGIVYIGNIHTPVGHFPGVIIREQDLQISRGKTLTQTTLEEREVASRKAEIRGSIAARKQAIANAHRDQNPHQSSYHEALRRYQTLRREAQQLQTTYERSTSSERVTAGNRLREIRQEMATLTPSIRNLQQQRDRWAEANPLGPPPNPDQDAQVRALRQQLAELESEAMTPR